MRDLLYVFLSFFAPMFRRLYKNRVRVLAYHEILDENLFTEQVKHLRRKYNIITLDDLRDHLYKEKPLPARSILITFDDGDVSIKTKGIKILQDERIQSCLFIVTSLINTNNNFWWRNVYDFEKAKNTKEEDIRKKINYLKNIRNTERIKLLEAVPNMDQNQLSAGDLVYLEENGVIVANHSHTHPMFDQCSKEEVAFELQESKKNLQKWGVSNYDVFAYPNGNFDLVGEKILVEEGVKMAFLFDHKINNKTINPLRISRIRVDSDLKLKEFAVKTSGIHSLLIKRSLN